MIGEIRNEFREQFHYNQEQEARNLTKNGHSQITNTDILNALHLEFKKPFITKLYPNPEWQQRIFWNIAGNLQNTYDNLNIDVSLDRITQAMNTYLEQNKISTPPSQRDDVKFIRGLIQEFKINGMTKIADMMVDVIATGITPDRFDTIISQMEREGSIFEPKEGYLKCV